jgi:hypothetical protein
LLIIFRSLEWPVYQDYQLLLPYLQLIFPIYFLRKNSIPHVSSWAGAQFDQRESRIDLRVGDSFVQESSPKVSDNVKIPCRQRQELLSVIGSHRSENIRCILCLHIDDFYWR